MPQRDDRKVAVIGAGPVGLAAAAHLLERGITPIVVEAGRQIANSVRQWSHVRLFSPWQYNIDKASKRLLDAVGWNSPDPDYYPTGAELIGNYLDPLATRTVLHEHIRTSSYVTGISRVGCDKVKTAGRSSAPFEIHYRNGAGLKSVLADAVIDTSGTWNSPNPAGANGLPAIGENAASTRIAYGMPDVLGQERARYDGRTVAVLGAGHSAAGSLIELSHLAKQSPSTRVIWILRGTIRRNRLAAVPTINLRRVANSAPNLRALSAAVLSTCSLDFASRRPKRRPKDCDWCRIGMLRSPSRRRSTDRRDGL